MTALHSRLVTDKLQQQQQWEPYPPLQFAAIALTARLAGHNAASLPADSTNRLAAMLAYCSHALKTAPDSMLDEAEPECSPQTLACSALVPALAALGSLHQVLGRFAPLEYATSWYYPGAAPASQQFLPVEIKQDHCVQPDSYPRCMHKCRLLVVNLGSTFELWQAGVLHTAGAHSDTRSRSNCAVSCGQPA
jgi:hypothetical protein